MQKFEDILKRPVSKAAEWLWCNWWKSSIVQVLCDGTDRTSLEFAALDIARIEMQSRRCGCLVVFKRARLRFDERRSIQCASASFYCMELSNIWNRDNKRRYLHRSLSVYLVGTDTLGSRLLLTASSSLIRSTGILWYPIGSRFVAPMDNRGCLLLLSLSRLPSEFGWRGMRVRSVWLIVYRRLRALSLMDGVAAGRIACWDMLLRKERWILIRQRKTKTFLGSALRLPRTTSVLTVY